MKRILALILCIISVSGCVITQPIKVQASYAVPAGYGVDFIRALYTLFESVLIATGIAQGIDNYSECDNIWEAFNKFVDDITPSGYVEPETGEKVYYEGMIQFEECQVQIYHGKWYVYGYEVKDLGGGIYAPDCYAVFENYNDFLEYMGCPVEIPETTWRQFTVIEGGKGNEPAPTPPPETELDNKTQIAFTGGTVGVMVEFIKKVIAGEVEGVNPDDYIEPDLGKKEDVINNMDSVIEIIEKQTGYDETLSDEWGFELPDYSYTGIQQYGEAGNTIVNGYCYVEFGVNNELSSNYLRRYFIETYQPDNVCLQLKWCETRNKFGMSVSDPHYELKLMRKVGADASRIYYQEYDLDSGTWGEAKINDIAYAIDIGGSATKGDPRFQMAFDCPIFKYGESGASATDYFNNKNVNVDDLLNGGLYNQELMIENTASTLSPIEDCLIPVEELKGINESMIEVLENTVPETTNPDTNTNQISNDIADVVEDKVQDLDEVIIPEPDFYPETNPNPDVIQPSTAPEVSPSTAPEVSPSTAPEVSPSTAPEVSPSTAPEVSPSTAPEVSPSTAPEVSPSTAPEVSPGTAPEVSPGTETEPEVLPSSAPDTGNDADDESQIETDKEPVPSSPPVDVPEDLTKYSVDLTTVFPFCLPFDLMRLFEALDAEPITPNFTFPFVVPALGIYMDIPIDLSWLDSVMIVFRLCMKITFIFGLIYVTGKVIKW